MSFLTLGLTLCLSLSLGACETPDYEQFFENFDIQELFHEHEYGEWEETVAPTCTTNGEKQRVCAKDESHVEKEEIPATGHAEIQNQAQAPTCTEIGWNAYVTCENCTYSTYSEIPANGHEYGEWYETLAPTDKAQGEKRRDCKNCPDYQTSPVAILPHDHANYERTTLPAVPPTCTQPGLTEGKKCSDCGEILIAQETVKANGHTEIQNQAQAPTCTEIGWNAYVTCENCTYSTYSEIPTAGHVYENGLCKSCDEPQSVGLEYSLSADQTYYIVSGIGTCEDTEIYIPIRYESKPVKEIKAGAFEQTAITSVTVPNSVTVIGNGAFWNCNSLKNIVVPDTLTNIERFFAPNGTPQMEYNEYDNGLYLGNQENKYIVFVKPVSTSISSCAIHETAKYIFPSAFDGCNSLTEITLPDSVLSIGSSAFYNCAALTSAEIGNSVTSIDYYAFYNCTNLTDLTIGNSVKTIGSSAFESCTSLRYLVLPDSLLSVDGRAFFGCKSLTNLTIGKSVATLGSSAFMNCCMLVEIYNRSTLPLTVGGTDGSYADRYAKEIYAQPYDSKVSCDEDGYFFYTDGDLISLIGYTGADTAIVLPENITEINHYAFYNTRLTNVTLPDSVTAIGKYAFYICTDLSSINIPNDVTYIGDYAFYQTKLENVTIPDSVTTIGDYAFYGCKSLTDISIGNSLESIGKSAFYSCSNLTSVTLPDSLTTIGDSAFYYCGALTDVALGNSVETIGNNAFANTGLTDIIIPDPVTTIGDGAFMQTKLKSVTLGNSLLSLGHKIFYGCSKLESIVIPDSVTTIGDQAFYGCTSLTSVTIGKGVTHIGGTPTYRGGSAFYSCTKLTAVYIQSVEAWCNVTFYGLESNPLYFAKNLYLNNQLVTDLVISDTVTQINAYAFACGNFQSVIIGDSVTTINDQAFYKCTALKNVTIGSSVTTMVKAFKDCKWSTDKTVTFKNPNGWQAGGTKVTVTNESVAADNLLQTYAAQTWIRRDS